MAPRYLHALPCGVVRWLGRKPPADPDGTTLHRLFTHILFAPSPVALDLPTWSRTLNMPPPNLAQALFALNREHCVQVDTQAQTQATPGWHTLQEQLHAMSIRLGRTPLVLADPDGLCIHACHAAAEPAQALAASDAPLLHRMPLFMGVRPFQLVSPAALPTTDPGWTDIARSLWVLTPRSA
ncbi:MAG TPA: hypothetical protein VFY35_01940 [Burkholderiaceae bacterium]|nr:hypothetical protein [Burkholderiaceae bacterium]